MLSIAIVGIAVCVIVVSACVADLVLRYNGIDVVGQAMEKAGFAYSRRVRKSMVVKARHHGESHYVKAHVTKRVG